MDNGDIFLCNGIVREENEPDTVLIAGQDYIHKVNEKTGLIKTLRKIMNQ
jgi:hypothetical protein